MKAYIYLRQIYWGKNDRMLLLLEWKILKLKHGQIKLAL